MFIRVIERTQPDADMLLEAELQQDVAVFYQHVLQQWRNRIMSTGYCNHHISEMFALSTCN